MKTAVSIPDEVFEEAECLAADLKTSRSQLYSRALREFVARHAPDRVTEAMNQVIAEVGEGSAGPRTSAGSPHAVCWSVSDWRFPRVRSGGPTWENPSDPALGCVARSVVPGDDLNQSRIGTT